MIAFAQAHQDESTPATVAGASFLFTQAVAVGISDIEEHGRPFYIDPLRLLQAAQAAIDRGHVLDHFVAGCLCRVALECFKRGRRFDRPISKRIKKLVGRGCRFVHNDRWVANIDAARYVADVVEFVESVLAEEAAAVAA